MPSFQFLRSFVTPLSKISIVTSVPMIFLLVGLQAIMDVKFSCPCRVERNHYIICCIFFAPAIFALVIMLLLLRPCKFEHNCCSSQEQNKFKSSCCSSQEQNNRGTSQGKDSSGTSQGKDSSGTSQGKDSRGTSQGKDSRGTSPGKDSSGTSQGKESRGTSQGKDSSGTSQGKDSRGKSPGKGSSGTSQGKESRGTSQGKESRGTSQGKDSSGTSQSEINELVETFSCFKVFVVCCIPCLLWICLFFIDGDYLACGFTDWNGHYACDNELHPRCVNWCKPTKLSPPKNETECYERTLKLIFISKFTGYVLVIIFCLPAIIFVSFDCKRKRSADHTDEDIQGHQGPGTTGQQVSGGSATMEQHESKSSQAGEGQEESGGSATAVKGEQGSESSDMEMEELLSDHQHKESCQTNL